MLRRVQYAAMYAFSFVCFVVVMCIPFRLSTRMGDAYLWLLSWAGFFGYAIPYQQWADLREDK